MLPSSKRLRTAEVREILSIGRSVRGSNILSAKTLPSQKGGFRAAAVVSKKLAKTAIMRNRLRRAIYRALEQQQTVPSVKIALFLKVKPPLPMAPVLRSEIEGILRNVQ